MKKILSAILTFIICAGMTASIASANDDSKAKEPTVPEFSVGTYLKAGEDHKMSYLEEESEISPIAQVILKIIDMMVTIIGALAALVLIIGGLMMATAGGNEQQLQTGKDILKYSIAGLAVAFLSFIIITFVQSVLT